MDRRKALKNVALLLGTAISSSTLSVLFESFGVYEGAENNTTFSKTDEEILGEYADIILPTTSSSLGAKAAGLGTFIAMMVKDCYPSNLQEIFASGMNEMLAKCQKDFSKDFMATTAEERHQLMSDLTSEAIANKKRPSFFMIARDLTLLGYFSSEIGCTQAREYLPIPGKYDGNADYKPGQKAWAT